MGGILPCLDCATISTCRGLQPNFWIDITHPGHLLDAPTGWTAEVDAILGVPAGKLPRSVSSFIRFVHPDDLGHVIQIMAQAMARREPYRVSYRLFQDDGDVIFVRENTIVDCDQDGQPVRLIGNLRDITAQVQTWIALRDQPIPDE